jgi:hypothetical protein
MFQEMFRAAIEYEQAMARLRKIFGSDAGALAIETARNTELGQRESVAAVHECLASGRTLEQTRSTIRRALDAKLPVRWVLVAEIRAEAWPDGAATQHVVRGDKT